MPRYNQAGPLDSIELEAGDVGFARMNARLRPDQLQPGELAMSINGRMGLDGAWQTRPGVNSFGPVLTTDALALTVPWYTYARVDILTADRVGTLVTVTTDGAHSFNNSTLVGIAGLTGSVNPNGNRLITVTDTDEFTFTISGAVGNETYGGTGTVGAPYVDDDAISGVYGSCLFSNPADENAQYIILASNIEATAVNLVTGVGTTIEYPSGIRITESCELLQAFDKVYLFRNGLTALSWNGVLTGSPAFAKVANGSYAASAYYNANNNTVIADGVVTVTEASHGLTVGTMIYVVDNGSTLLTEERGYPIATVPGSGSFTFFAQVADATATTVVYSVKQSQGLGFTHMPAPPWAAYHERRLIVPYFYTTTGSSGSEVITDRDIRDEILFSDVLDGDTYDRLENQFRVTGGVADYLVALQPFTQDNLIAFNRNSIHLIAGVSGDLTDILINLITREVGCLARRSVVQVGNQILFLSDSGIYAATFQDLYNLRGNDLPLSAAIQPLIDRINPAYAQNAVAAYFNNRYYLAVPLDGSMENNALLIYNFQNGGWESLDIIDREGWNIANLISGAPTAVNKLYAVNSNGGIHIIDERADDVDLLGLLPGAAAASYAIESEATTRGYTFGNLERKKYASLEMQLESSASNASDGSVGLIAENTDVNVNLTTISNQLGAPLAAGNDAILRARMGNKRAYSLQLKLTPTSGRPKLRSARVLGLLTSPSTLQTS